MPNGKGTLDCIDCRHHCDGHCDFHGADLPQGTLNRICGHFEPTESYWQDNGRFFPPALRFTWFRHDFEPGVLYLFSYNSPDNIDRSIVLRKPDYKSNRWQKVKPSTG
jgi:hypothetical protein